MRVDRRVVAHPLPASPATPLPAPSLGLKRYATVVVAAEDSLNKADSDFVCTGTNDENTLNAAITALPWDNSGFAASGGVGGGRILLREGSYNVSGNVNLDLGPAGATWIEIEGLMGAVINVTNFSGSNAVIGSRNLHNGPTWCRIAGLSFLGNVPANTAVLALAGATWAWVERLYFEIRYIPQQFGLPAQPVGPDIDLSATTWPWLQDCSFGSFGRLDQIDGLPSLYQGIWLSGSSLGVIGDNVWTPGWFGPNVPQWAIDSTDEGQMLIRGNQFYGAGARISARSTWTRSEIIVADNVFEPNNTVAEELLLTGINDADIHDNIFSSYNETVPNIRLTGGSSRNFIHGNLHRLANGPPAVNHPLVIDAGCADNLVVLNDWKDQTLLDNGTGTVTSLPSTNWNRS